MEQKKKETPEILKKEQEQTTNVGLRKKENVFR